MAHCINTPTFPGTLAVRLPAKSQQFKKGVEFLGLKVGKTGIPVHDEKVRVVKQWPKPILSTESRFFGFDPMFEKIY